MKRALKFGILGFRRKGIRHALLIINIGSPRAACDADFSKAKLLTKDYMARVYNLNDQLLESEKEPDLAVICTPNEMPRHIHQALKARP